MRKLVKITNRAGQCTITIPISIARKTGLDKADFAMVEINKKNIVEVREIDINKTKA